MNGAELNSFYKENVGLVHFVARKSYGRLQRMGATIEYEDLVQDMSMIFIRSVELFDAERGKFSTYFVQAAYFELRRIEEVFATERIELKIKSVEEMASNAEEGEINLWDVIGSDDLPVDEFVDAKLTVAKMESELSPLAKKILEWSVQPPEEIKREYDAKAHHAQFARSLGFAVRNREPAAFGLACEMLELSGYRRSDVNCARAQLERAIERHKI